MKKYLVAYCTREFIGTGFNSTSAPQYKFKDHYRPFIEEVNGNSPLRQAQFFYNYIIKKTFKNKNKELYSANLAEIIESTDY